MGAAFPDLSLSKVSRDITTLITSTTSTGSTIFTIYLSPLTIYDLRCDELPNSLIN